MAYSQNNFEEALALRKEGKDDASVRMILASKRIPAEQIDAIFLALDEALPRKKGKSIEGFDSEKGKAVEKRDFYMLMIGLLIAGAIIGGIGWVGEIDILRVLGGGAAFLGLYGLSRGSRDDRREARRRNRDG